MPSVDLLVVEIGTQLEFGEKRIVVRPSETIYLRLDLPEDMVVVNGEDYTVVNSQGCKFITTAIRETLENFDKIELSDF